jgi:hypothetical protein
MDLKIINETFDLLKGYKYLGEKQLENGTLLIAKAPHIAPQAWLHCIFAPINANDVNILEGELNQKIPDIYKEFLEMSNGLSVFNTTFSLFGKRSNYKRSIDNVWQPFDLILSNTVEKPYNADDNVFIIGCYDWDGSYLYIDKKTSSVHLCKNDDITPLYKWKNFEDMLYSEINRLIDLFDYNGKEKNVEDSTLPSIFQNFV